MASVPLPAPSIWAEIKPSIISAGGADQTSPLDGSSQRVLRLGDKHSVEVQLPVKTEAAAREWLAPWKISQAEGATVTMPWPQPALGLPIGTPKVNGANQTGTQLVVDGLTPNLFLPAERYFSLVVSGRAYLFGLTRGVTANASGQATLSLDVMMRAKPADNADLEFNEPLIEGLFSGAPSWGLIRKRFYGISFTLIES